MSYVKIKTVEDAVTRIIDWEIETTKRFIDSFMSDNIDGGGWAYWLLSKGYVNHANNIIFGILSGDDNISLEFLYNIFDENDDDAHLAEENIIKNIELMSEFLVESPKNLEKLNNFLENN